MDRTFHKIQYYCSICNTRFVHLHDHGGAIEHSNQSRNLEILIKRYDSPVWDNDEIIMDILLVACDGYYFKENLTILSEILKCTLEGLLQVNRMDIFKFLSEEFEHKSNLVKKYTKKS